MPYSKGVGNRDFYNFYKENAIKKKRTYVDYQTYSKVLKAFNKKIRDKILYDAEIVTLPYRLGDLYIRKLERIHDETNHRWWNINFKETKLQGKTIYHEDKYGYKWQWNKKRCIVKGQKWHLFRACRTANRLIADAIKNKNLDYFEKQ